MKVNLKSGTVLTTSLDITSDNNTTTTAAMMNTLIGCQQPSDSAPGMRSRDNKSNDNFGYCDYVDHVMGLKCYSDLARLGVFASTKQISESMAVIWAADERLMKSKPAIAATNSKDPVLCLCTGDGNTPRTAVLAAYWKQWNCVSIDPNLRDNWVGEAPQGVRGLTGFKGTLEEYLDTLDKVSIHNDVVSLPVSSCVAAEKSIVSAPSLSKSSNNNVPSADAAPKITLVLLCVHSDVQFQQQTSLSRIEALHYSAMSSIVSSSSDTSMLLVSMPCSPEFRHIQDVGRQPDKTYEDDCVFSAGRTVDIWQFPTTATTNNGLPDSTTWLDCSKKP